MSNQKDSPASGLPADEHLRNDVAPNTPPGEESKAGFTPGQTNAGQQVGGLASAAGYEEKDPDKPKDTNSPA